MKRCNNCGWYNQDSVISCVKCQDCSFEPVLEAAIESVDSASEPVQTISKSISDTVTFVDATMQNATSMRKKYAATVLDTGAVQMDTKENVCHKCRYPIVGNVDYCPNCGATIKNNSKKEISTLQKEDKSVSVLSLKATVRDIPESLIEKDENVYTLISLDAPDKVSFKMRPGDVISIGGQRYKFQK